MDCGCCHFIALLLRSSRNFQLVLDENITNFHAVELVEVYWNCVESLVNIALSTTINIDDTAKIYEFTNKYISPKISECHMLQLTK